MSSMVVIMLSNTIQICKNDIYMIFQWFNNDFNMILYDFIMIFIDFLYIFYYISIIFLLWYIMIL